MDILPILGLHMKMSENIQVFLIAKSKLVRHMTVSSILVLLWLTGAKLEGGKRS